MTGPDETREPHLLSGAYVLHAVSEEEARTVEAAAERSEEFRGELAGLTDTAVLLGLSVPEETPPAALRARLLDALDNVPQLAPVAAAVDDQVAMTQFAGASHVARGRRRRRPAVWIAAVTAAVLLFGGGIAIDRLVQAPQAEYTAISAAVDVQRATAAVQGGGTATVSWSRSVDATAVQLTDVHAPTGRVLQLWRLDGSKTTSEGLYDSGDSFRLLDGTPSAGERLAVTVEPAGGSARPTTTPITFVGLS